MNENARRVTRLLRKKISAVMTEANQAAADEEWGCPGEAGVKGYPWYVSKGQAREEIRRLEAGLEPRIDGTCLNTTWWWIESARCADLGHQQEWIQNCELCVPRLHREGPPGLYGRAKVQPCGCDLCVLSRLEEQ
jgi:hypothetical protein